MTSRLPTLCDRCKHQITGGKCKAYPEYIPEVFFNGEKNHTELVGDEVEKVVYTEDVPNK